MTWCPGQVCTAGFAHAMHIWTLDDGQARYCPGVWTESADLVQGDAKLRGNSGDADATENHNEQEQR